MERSPDPIDNAGIERALLRLLRPLVRLLIARGVTFPMLSSLLQRLYVSVAEREFVLPGKPQTDSRLSLLTGLHRKLVNQLVASDSSEPRISSELSQASRILARWLADPAYVDEDGKPRPLPRSARHGAPSFETLVRSITTDVRPRAVLDAWLDRGLVGLDADRNIVLADTALVPKAGSEEQLYYFGRNLHDHMAAAVANVQGPAPRFFERSVHYDGLSQSLAEQLEARSREIAMRALIEANREAHDSVETAEPGPWRWNLGIYVYAEPVADGRAPKQSDRSGASARSATKLSPRGPA